MTYRERTRSGVIRITGKVSNPWPIGSVYIGVTSQNPTLLFGGTWEAFSKGKVLIGVDPLDVDFDAALKYGGSKTVSLITNQMPAHDHAIGHNHGSTGGGGNHNHSYDKSGVAGTGYAAGTDKGNINNNTSSDGQHDHVIPSYSGLSGTRGDGQPIDNLQPFITCYIWKRTA